MLLQLLKLSFRMRHRDECEGRGRNETTMTDREVTHDREVWREIRAFVELSGDRRESRGSGE